MFQTCSIHFKTICFSLTQAFYLELIERPLFFFCLSSFIQWIAADADVYSPDKS